MQYNKLMQHARLFQKSKKKKRLELDKDIQSMFERTQELFYDDSNWKPKTSKS